MKHPPTDVAVGDRLSQDEIEEIFETGFGYQIAGINPCRDSQDRRYAMAFANEDGPYDDSITHGRFEYIGEGQTGDQNEKSPGNSTLIDAVSEGFPVYFFYKGSEMDGWEYRGPIDVQGYDIEQRGGRDVIVFDMEHRE